MATKFHVRNDDNVYNLIEKPQEKFITSPRYQSIHKERMKCEIAKAKSAHKTFGVPKVSLRSPCDFIKKKSHLKTERPKVNHVHYRRPNYQHHLPKWTPVKICKTSCNDKLAEFPRDPMKRGRLNFCKQNIENVKNYVSKPLNFKTVYTRHGDNHELSRSGLMPHYIYKKNFGKLPPYLSKKPFTVVTRHQDYRKAKKNDCKEYEKQKHCRYVTQEERAQLLKKMKKHWSESMKQFQCLPFLIDTPAKIKRKVAMERVLRQLEEDIDLLEKHRYIYVCADEDFQR